MSKRKYTSFISEEKDTDSSDRLVTLQMWIHFLLPNTEDVCEVNEVISGVNLDECVKSGFPSRYIIDSIFNDIGLSDHTGYTVRIARSLIDKHPFLSSLTPSREKEYNKIFTETVYVSIGSRNDKIPTKIGVKSKTRNKSTDHILLIERNQNGEWFTFIRAMVCQIGNTDLSPVLLKKDETDDTPITQQINSDVFGLLDGPTIEPFGGCLPPPVFPTHSTLTVPSVSNPLIPRLNQQTEQINDSLSVVSEKKRPDSSSIGGGVVKMARVGSIVRQCERWIGMSKWTGIKDFANLTACSQTTIKNYCTLAALMQKKKLSFDQTTNALSIDEFRVSNFQQYSTMNQLYNTFGYNHTSLKNGSDWKLLFPIAIWK